MLIIKIILLFELTSYEWPKWTFELRIKHFTQTNILQSLQ
jgi:hypothetical protein